ncbi:hypothetical protein A6R71_03845 [Xanthomonas translucens pv. arrhenatheri]|nr:hypothetical protein A6R71_03845 [Xanthomonas translucens pv. arrhenatheri]
MANLVVQFVAASDLLALIEEYPLAAQFQLTLQIHRYWILWNSCVFKLLADFDKFLGFWQQFRIDPAPQLAFWRGQITF